MKLLIFLLLIVTFAWAQEASPPLHSHNDYLQPRFLQEALENDFKSIEVDIWQSKGQLKVSHFPWGFKGNIEDLYLRPLQKMVDEKKLKTTPENPLLLWIDIKAFRKSTIPLLADVLKKYPMIGKDVRIIITGRKKLKRKLLEDFPDLPIERDENSLKVDAKAKSDFSWYTLKWKDCSKWDGQSPIPAQELSNLRAIVDKVHAEGRKLRFYASPENEAYWKLMKELKVDLVDTDNIPALQKFWESLNIKLPPAPVRVELKPFKIIVRKPNGDDVSFEDEDEDPTDEN